jgi:tetratricopeptide (TPR) repeat protein
MVVLAYRAAFLRGGSMLIQRNASFWRLALVVLIFAANAIIAMSAHAQNSEQIEWCNGKSVQSSDLRIGACTALIQSGRLNSKNLAAAFIIAYQGKQDNDRAIQDYTQTLLLSPTNVLAYNNRGNVYLNKREYDLAIKDYDRVIEIEPNADRYLNRGVAYANKGNFDQAIRDYTKSIELQPRYALALTNRGVARFVKQQYEDAIQDITEAIALEPNAFRLTTRGNAYERKRNYDGAINDYDEAIRLSQNYQDAFVGRCVTYNDKRDYDRALQDCDKAIILNPNSASGYVGRCAVYINKSDNDEALKDCNRAIELDPKNYLAFQNRGGILFNIGQYDRAVQSYDAALRISPNQARALYGRGQAKLKSGDTEGGNRDVAAAKLIDPAIVSVAYQNPQQNTGPNLDWKLALIPIGLIVVLIIWLVRLGSASKKTSSENVANGSTVAGKFNMIRFPLETWRATLLSINSMRYFVGTSFAIAFLISIANRAAMLLTLQSPDFYGIIGLQRTEFLVNLLVTIVLVILLSPLAIAIDRHILLGETSERYMLNLSDRRFQNFVGISMFIYILPAIAILFPRAHELHLVNRVAVIAVGLSALLLLAAGAFLILRSVALWPAIAVDAPNAKWSNAIQSTKGHFWKIVLCVALAALPTVPYFAYLFFGIPLSLLQLLKSIGPYPSWSIIIGIDAICTVLFFSLFSATASLLYLNFGGALGRPINLLAEK